MQASPVRSCSRSPTTKGSRFRSSSPTWRARALRNSGSNDMSENFDGPKIERARILLIERFRKDEMDMAITDISLANPQFPQEGSYEIWLQKTFVYLNSKRQLGKLFVE